MRITLREPAGGRNLFDRGVVAGLVGREVPVVLGSHRKTGRVLEALVIEDGAAILLSAEVPPDDDVDRVEEALAPQIGRYSIGLGP